MDAKTILLELRTQKGLSQDELAEKIFVTRQAVSRWENGETIHGIKFQFVEQISMVSLPQLWFHFRVKPNETVSLLSTVTILRTLQMALLSGL